MVSALCPLLQFLYLCCPSSPPIHTQTLQTYEYLAVFHFFSLPFWLHNHHCHCFPAASADSFSVLLAQAILLKQVREEKTLGVNLWKGLTSAQGEVCMLIHWVRGLLRRPKKKCTDWSELCFFSINLSVPLACHRGQCSCSGLDWNSRRVF